MKPLFLFSEDPRMRVRGLPMALLATALMLSGAACTTNALRSQSSNPPAWAHQSSDLAPDPAVHFGQLPNGFRYILKSNPLPERRVSMHLNVQVGSLHESDDEQGLAHFLEHLQFNGSTHYPPGELVKYFQRIGMEFGPDANAHTGFNETVYDILLASNSAEDIREGLTVLSDYAQGALLLPEEIARERRVILAEKRSRDSASYRTFVETLAFEFPQARLAQRLPIGKEATIRRMDRELIRAFYDAWYRPEMMMAVVVGDISIPDTERAIRDVFGGLTPRAPARPIPGVGDFRHQGVKSFHHHEKELGETTVRLEVLASQTAPADSLDERRRRTIADMADRIVQNRLSAMLSQPSTPFTSADISSGAFLEEIHYAEISAECDPQAWSETLAAIENVLRQALTYGFSADELDRVKKDLFAELDRAEKQMPTRLSQDISRRIIRSVNRGQVVMSPRQEKSFYGGIIATVTPEDVWTAFRETWHYDHRLVLVTGNAQVAEDAAVAEAMVLDAYNAAAALAVAPPEEKERMAFPYRPSPDVLGDIAAKTVDTGLGISRMTLANGVTVLIKPTDFKADDVQVRLSFGPGRAGEPAALPGLAIFAEDLINEGGVGPLTKTALDAALAGKNIATTFTVREDRFVFAGHSGKRDAALLFQLLSARLQDPAFRPDAARLVKARYAQSYKAAAATFRGALRVWGRRQLAGGDPRFGWAPEDAYRARTIAEAKGWIMPYFMEAPLEVVIVGDVAVEQAERMARRYFGALATRGTGKAVMQTVDFPAGKRFETAIATAIDNSLLVVALPTDDVWDISQTRRLSILAEVISEKLRVVVREALGATYSPFAFNRGSRAYSGYGTLMILAEVAPGDAGRVETEIRRLLDDLVSEGIDEDLLQRVLDPTLTGIRDMKKQNRYWTDTVLSGASRHPEQLAWATTIAEDYAAITVDDINTLARRYLLLPRAATLFFHPETADGAPPPSAGKG